MKGSLYHTLYRIRPVKDLKLFFSSIPASKIVLDLPMSGIREIWDAAYKLEVDTGVKCIHLEVGQPNFPTAQHIKDACIESLNLNETTYIPNSGLLDLRLAVAAKYNKTAPFIKTNPDNIIITTGAMMSLFSLLIALLQPGEECLVPFPGKIYIIYYYAYQLG